MMNKKNIITVLGTLVIVLPFLGIPTSISTPLYVAFGIIIVYIARSATKKKVLENKKN